MKKLELEFTGNYDQVGVTRFVQVKRTNEVAMYRRERKDGTFKSFEVFIVKTRKKGDPLPNGAVEKEDRECYAGTSQFGKTAYDCKTESQAEQRFDELLLKSKNQSEAKEEAIKTGKPNKGRRGTKKTVVIPEKGNKFTMKMLITNTGLTQPVLFSIVKSWLDSGTIKINGYIKPEGGRGRPSIEYVVV